MKYVIDFCENTLWTKSTFSNCYDVAVTHNFARKKVPYKSIFSAQPLSVFIVLPLNRFRGMYTNSTWCPTRETFVWTWLTEHNCICFTHAVLNKKSGFYKSIRFAFGPVENGPGVFLGSGRVNLLIDLLFSRDRSCKISSTLLLVELAVIQETIEMFSVQINCVTFGNSQI